MAALERCGQGPSAVGRCGQWLSAVTVCPLKAWARAVVAENMWTVAA